MCWILEPNNKCINNIWYLKKLFLPSLIWKGKGNIGECPNYGPIRLLCHKINSFLTIVCAPVRICQGDQHNRCDSYGPSYCCAIWAHKLKWKALRNHGIPQVCVQCNQMLYHSITIPYVVQLKLHFSFQSALEYTKDRFFCLSCTWIRW